MKCRMLISCLLLVDLFCYAAFQSLHNITSIFYCWRLTKTNVQVTVFLNSLTVYLGNGIYFPFQDLFPPLCFYDVSGGQEQTNSSGSFTNEAEAQFVILLLSVLAVRGLPASSVGVITLYKAQARRIVDAIRGCRSVTSEAQQQMAGVQVSTVDAFQGGERDIIILSCVRTRSLGFIDSDKWVSGGFSGVWRREEESCGNVWLFKYSFNLL